MKYKKIILLTIFTLILQQLTGCSGGGGGSTPLPSGDAPPPQAQNIISGTASKAPISAGDVAAYKIENGKKGTLITTGKTAADGSYSLNVASYSGPVIIEISGGTYIDEATGTSATIPVDAPLHTVLPVVSSQVKAAITPLTELAYQVAGTNLNTATITSANKAVSVIFNLYDITAVQPVQPTALAINALPTTIQGTDQKDYTLTLATFSQLAASQNKTVAQTVTYIKDNIINNTLKTDVVTNVQQAAATYFTQNTNNGTGINSPINTSIATIGAKRVVVRIATAGILPTGNSIKGIALDVNLPEGVTVKSDTNGILSNYLSKSGQAGSNSIVIGTQLPNSSTIRINLTDSTGIITGEFLTLTCDVAYNASTPTKDMFSIPPGYSIIDLKSGIGTQALSTIFPEIMSVSLQ